MSKFSSLRKRVTDLERARYSAKEEEKTPAWFEKALTELTGEQIELLNEADKIRVKDMANGEGVLSMEEDKIVDGAFKLLNKLQRKYDPSYPMHHAPKYEEEKV